MIDCKHCGTINPDGSRYCRACGRRLPLDLQFNYHPERLVIPASKAGFESSAGSSMNEGDLAAKRRITRRTLIGVVGGMAIVTPVVLFAVGKKDQVQSGGVHIVGEPSSLNLLTDDKEEDPHPNATGLRPESKYKPSAKGCVSLECNQDGEHVIAEFERGTDDVISSVRIRGLLGSLSVDDKVLTFSYDNQGRPLDAFSLQVPERAMEYISLEERKYT